MQMQQVIDNYEVTPIHIQLNTNSYSFEIERGRSLQTSLLKSLQCT